MAGPLGLAWRLQRGTLIGWAAGFLLLGLVFGNIATNVGDLLDSPAAKELIQKLGGARTLTDAFMATELGMLSVAAAAYAVQVVLRLRSEESELRAEPILATKVSRLTWAGSHITISLLGTAGLLVAAVVGAGLTYAAQTGEPHDFWRVLVAASVRAPAAWVLIGIAVLIFGLVPRATTLAWAALVTFLLIGEFGPLFNLDQWAMNLSPFAHAPRLPGGELSAVPLVSLAAVAGALIVAGLGALRRRDMPIS